MGDPEFRSDEQVLVRTMGVSVKSIPFEGILTSRRIILVDRAKNILPPKEIPLATIKSVEPGENANRGPTLLLAVMAKTGDTRQMILTFSRSSDRDEWARIIRESASPSFEQVIRKVIPGADQAPRKTTTAPRIEVVNTPVPPPVEAPQRVSVKRAAEGIPLSRKIIETGTAGAPAPAPVHAVKEFDASSLGENLFCNRCGNPVSADSAFCNRCGAPVVPPEAPASRPAAPRQYAPGPAPEPAYEQPATPDAQLRQSLSWDEEQGADTVPAARAPAQKAPKKGIFSGLFGSKKQRETPPVKPRSEPAAARPKQGLLGGILGSKKPGKAVPAEAAAAPRPRRESRSILPKKGLLAIVAVIVVVLVVAVGALFIYPMLTSGSLIPSSGTSVFRWFWHLRRSCDEHSFGPDRGQSRGQGDHAPRHTGNGCLCIGRLPGQLDRNLWYAVRPADRGGFRSPLLRGRECDRAGYGSIREKGQLDQA